MVPLNREEEYIKDMTGQLEDIKFNSSSIIDNLGRTTGS